MGRIASRVSLTGSIVSLVGAIRESPVCEKLSGDLGWAVHEPPLRTRVYLWFWMVSVRGVRFIAPSLLMVYKCGSDVRAHAADCFVTLPYGFNRQSRRGDS